MKKTIIPLVLLTVGVVGLAVMLTVTPIVIFVKHSPTGALVFAVPGIAKFLLYVSLGCTARALYTKSRKVLLCLKALKWSAYVSGALYAFTTLYWATHDSITAGNMHMPSDYSLPVLMALNLLSGLIILDLISEYIELKAESFLTI